MQNRCRWVVILFFLSFPAIGDEAVPDIRVAIDVSGSMKKNDPKMLRAPALKLLVGLMPENMYAGVWTFGQYVNMEVKYGRVDQDWKIKARAAAVRIHSKARFTNIEEAIQRASFNWKKADARFNRNLILLTDGKVDITRDQDVNQASRDRILEYWVPRLQKAGVRVHSVALSKDVDQDLMTTLSRRTGGWYEQVDNAEQLQRVFLRLFEKSARQDTVPLKGNRFSIDKDVSDMTVLVFNKDNNKALKINSPTGERWSEQSAPGHVTWFHEDEYDLVTVKKPDSGVWVLETESDPDNRVMVVTNLKLKVNPLPDHLLLGDKIHIEASLVDKNKTVTRQDFLKLVQFSLLVQGEGEANSDSLVLLDNGEEGDKSNKDGVYTLIFAKQDVAGMHTLIIRADGATFQREQRHTVNIHPDVANIVVDKMDGGYKLSVEVNQIILEPKSVALSIENLTDQSLEWQQNNNLWTLVLPSDFSQEFIDIKLTAKDKNAKPVEKIYQQRVLPEKVQKKEKPHEDENQEHIKEESETNTDEEVKEESESNWSLVLWLTILINLILIIIGVVVWVMLKKRKAKTDAEESAEINV